MLLVLGIGDGVEEQFEAGDAADIFGWRAAGAVDVAGILGSGIGVVHNALLLADVERSVVRGPFRPFPRSASIVRDGGQFTILPKPPWFASSRTAAEVSEGLTRFRAQGGVLALVRTLVQAMRA